jgi:putative oxidoreductase
MSDAANLVSRMLLSAVFIFSGYLKFVNVTTITDNPGTKRIMDLVAAGAPAPVWLSYLPAAMEMAGGLAIIVGFKTRWVALAFVIYLIIITPLGHPFWLLEGAARSANQVNFNENLAILGGYLLLATTGPGRYALDNRSR